LLLLNVCACVCVWYPKYRVLDTDTDTCTTLCAVLGNLGVYVLFHMYTPVPVANKIYGVSCTVFVHSHVHLCF